MASIGTFKTPVKAGVGGCLDAGWYRTAACPSICRLEMSNVNMITAVNFSSRGKVDGNLYCGGPDTYVAFPGAHIADIDVWKAYRDSIWTSSVTVLVYVGSSSAAGTFTLNFKKNKWAATIDASKSLSITQVGGCPTALQATLTITDKGVCTLV